MPLGTGDDARRQAIDASYGAATSRLNPAFDQRQESLDAQLMNQGLDPNSAAYRNAQRDFSMQRNDAYNQAMNSAISNGNQAQSLTFNQNLASRNNGLSQLAQLAGLTGTGPQYNQAGLAESNQALSAAQFQNQADMNAWQAQQRATADAIGAGAQLIGGVGRMAFGF
jgi:hypothetical protein